jgi:hypothetical protein
MRFLAAATRMKEPPADCAERAQDMLEFFNSGPEEAPTAAGIAQAAFDLAEAISLLLGALRADPAHFADSPEVAWGVRLAAKVFRASYSALLPARIVSRGFTALVALLLVKAKPEGKEECTRWRELMADAHYFQNALHNYAIGFERDLPTGSETASGAPASVVISHAENVIVFPGRAGGERNAFDDIFGDGAPDR